MNLWQKNGQVPGPDLESQGTFVGLCTMTSPVVGQWASQATRLGRKRDCHPCRSGDPPGWEAEGRSSAAGGPGEMTSLLQGLVASSVPG